jgi:fermentation-respiration switch protein FrsA (DUF1100 family)
MTSTPSSSDPGPSLAQVRRRLFAIAAGLFAPIVVIWFAGATVIARELQFPPALAYSTSGPARSGNRAASDTRPLRELLETSSDEITLRQADGQPLRALIAPAASARTAVVLTYPNWVDTQAFLGYFKVVRSVGYPALIIEYPSSNALSREGRRNGFGWEQRRDVLDAVNVLHARGVQKTAVLGVSEGAAAGLFAAAQGAEIAAIISDSSYADLNALLRRIPPLDSLNPLFDRTVLWELGLMTGRAIDDISPAKAAAKLHAPLMVINGADDPLVPPADARQIIAAAHQPNELWIAANAGHAAELATDPDEYMRRVGDFLKRYLNAPTRSY